MSLCESKSFQCPECGENSEIEIWQSINVTEDPEARDQLIEGRVNVFVCPDCGYKALITVPLLYHDMELQYCVQYYPFEAMNREDILLQFGADGSINSETFTGLPLPEYMRTRHVVFSMDELVRYILFREKLSEYYS